MLVTLTHRFAAGPFPLPKGEGEEGLFRGQPTTPS
jgi:hypothetical protein